MMNRPTLNDAMKLEAAKKVAAEIQHVDVRPEQIADCFHQYMDGYELAKRLERDTCCYLSFDDVEELDQMDRYASDILLEAEKQWAIELDIKPPYPIGTMTTKGVIDGVDQYRPASYLIKPYGQDDDSCGSSRHVIKFENVIVSGVAA